MWRRAQPASESRLPMLSVRLALDGANLQVVAKSKACYAAVCISAIR